jgi:uncharacterized protein (DUF433 family)
MKLDDACPALLTRTSEGVLRITGTRITLDSIIQAFHDGATPEEMCQDFPGLALAHIYSVLAFYLTQKDAVDVYLKDHTQATTIIRQELQSTHADFIADLRHRLTARRASSTSHA